MWTPQRWSCAVFSDESRLACSLIFARLSYEKRQLHVTAKRASFLLFTFCLINTLQAVISSNSSEVHSINVNCHICRGSIEGFEGYVTSVNNTSDYFYELIYGWTIEVPQYHDIQLTFSWSNEEFDNKTSTCEICKPYFEIIYGYSTSEATFKIEKFFNIRQLTKLRVPSHKTEIRLFSGEQCNESQKSKNSGFALYFKAVPLEQTGSLYTLLSVFILGAFILLGIAYFCVIMKKKDDNHDVSTLPIPIYVDLDNPSGEFKKCKIKEEKKKRGRGLRLRTHHSSRLDEPKEITVISSLVEEASETIFQPENLITPDSSNIVPVVQMESKNKKQFFKKRLPPKVNLLNRFQRNTASTPRYENFPDESYSDDRLSKSDVVIYEKRKVSREAGTKIFDFDVLPPKEEGIAQTEFETSVFLHSSSASSGDSLPNESIRDLPFVSPK